MHSTSWPTTNENVWGFAPLLNTGVEQPSALKRRRLALQAGISPIGRKRSSAAEPYVRVRSAPRLRTVYPNVLGATTRVDDGLDDPAGACYAPFRRSFSHQERAISLGVCFAAALIRFRHYRGYPASDSRCPRAPARPTFTATERSYPPIAPTTSARSGGLIRYLETAPITSTRGLVLAL